MPWRGGFSNAYTNTTTTYIRDMCARAREATTPVVVVTKKKHTQQSPQPASLGKNQMHRCQLAVDFLVPLTGELGGQPDLWTHGNDTAKATWTAPDELPFLERVELYDDAVCDERSGHIMGPKGFAFMPLHSFSEFHSTEECRRAFPYIKINAEENVVRLTFSSVDELWLRIFVAFKVTAADSRLQDIVALEQTTASDIEKGAIYLVTLKQQVLQRAEKWKIQTSAEMMPARRLRQLQTPWNSEGPRTAGNR